jgi:tRNA modification GTPase
VRSLQGEFSARVHELTEQLTELRAYVEAAIDFPDEEIDFLDRGDVAARLARLFGSFDSLMAAARQGALLREGLTVVIAGKPNAGKSSLMNALAGSDVAIVTALPGTTRDVLRERVQVDGIPLHLIDTAGLRTAGDPIEAEGIRRAKGELERAERILYIVDATAADADLARELAQLPPGIPVTVVMNKIDLPGAAAVAAHGAAQITGVSASLALSARTGQGMDALRTHLKEIAGFVDGSGGTLSARRRHLEALDRARGHTLAAAGAMEHGRAPELLAEDLRLAQQALGEITGEFTSEDLLGRIFGSFCIGK